jgi:hypothetical protein
MRAYELHASAKQVQRSSGRSSVAASAYRSASIIDDERTGLAHDYSRKQGVEFSRIYAPDNAPDWAHDRSKLWNAVEEKENRSNSMTAREWVIAFPAEFNAMQRREAGDAVSKEIVSRLNAAVDIAYHEPNKEGDDRNYHAHILYTTRGFDEHSKDGWDSKKYRNYSQDKITVNDEKISRSAHEVETMRAFIAGEMNRIAQRDGLSVHTEHLSFEARGIDKEATQHLGQYASDMERKGKRSERGKINKKIVASNDSRDKLKEQQNVISLAHEREKRQVENLLKQQAQNQEQQSSDEIQNALALAARHKHFTHHKKNLDNATEALKTAKEKLGNIKFFERISLQKKKLEQDVLDKQKNYEDAQNRLKELVSSELLETRNKQSEISGYDDQTSDIKPKSVQERAEEARLYQSNQKELKALEDALNARNNIDRVIGSITGKTKAQQAKIAQLKENIKSHEAEQRQAERYEQQNQIAQKETLHKQQVSQQANDNTTSPQQAETPPDILKSRHKKKPAFDSLTAWKNVAFEKDVETRVAQMQQIKKPDDTADKKSNVPETPYTTLTPDEIQKNIEAQQAHSPAPPSFYDGLSAEHKKMLERHKADNPEQAQEKPETQEQSQSINQNISRNDHD